jgi:hypothetical protein
MPGNHRLSLQRLKLGVAEMAGTHLRDDRCRSEPDERVVLVLEDHGDGVGGPAAGLSRSKRWKGGWIDTATEGDLSVARAASDTAAGCSDNARVEFLAADGTGAGCSW